MIRSKMTISHSVRLSHNFQCTETGVTLELILEEGDEAKDVYADGIKIVNKAALENAKQQLQLCLQQKVA